MSIETIGSLVLGSGGLVMGCIAIYMARVNRDKTASETTKTKSEAKEIDERAAALGDERFRKQEEFWIRKVNEVEDKFEEEVKGLREEVSWLKYLIENHVPWDWEAERKMTLADVEHRPPPTLNWIRERRDQEKRDN